MYVFILAHGLNKENLNLNLNLNMFATPNRTDDACQVCHAAIYNNVMRHVQLKTTGLVADIRKKKKKSVTLAISSGTAHNTPTCIIRREIEGRRSRGRQRTMWMGNITEWSGFGYVETTRKARNRNYWRKFVASDPAM